MFVIMRFLSVHVDYFKTEMTERGRSALAENPEEKVIQTDESLVVLASVEKKEDRKKWEKVEITIHFLIKTISKNSAAKVLILCRQFFGF